MVPHVATGPATRSASLGSHWRTMMPIASGASTLAKTTLATASGAIPPVRSNALTNQETTTGTMTIASSATATSNPIAYASGIPARRRACRNSPHLRATRA